MKLETLKKVDKKYLIALGMAILGPFIYQWIRVFWISDNGNGSLALTQFQNYIQMVMEIMGAFLLIPLLTYKNKEYSDNSLSIYLAVIIVISFFIVIGMVVSMFLVKPMQNLNPLESGYNIKIFLIFQTLTSILLIYEQFLTTEIVVDKNANKAISLAIISISTKIIIDILFLSSISPFKFSIVLVSLSSFLSTLLIGVALTILYFISLFKDKTKSRRVNARALGKYYIKGIVPGLELLIRNLAYTFVTLQAILMLGNGTLQWNAWNMGGFVYWMILFKFTQVFEYHLLSEFLNEDKEYSADLSKWYLLFEVLIIVMGGVILSLTYIPSIGYGHDWMGLAVKLSLANIPIMVLIGIQNIIKNKIISENKYWYMLVSTIVTFIILQLPLIIVINFTNNIIGFWLNYLIFGISCLIPVIINFIQYLYINGYIGRYMIGGEKYES